MNYKFAVCAQPLKGEMVSVKSLFGKCELDDEIGEISKKIYEVFQIPMCKLILQRVESKAYLCGLQPLRLEEFFPSDYQMICDEISRISNKGEYLVG